MFHQAEALSGYIDYLAAYDAPIDLSPLKEAVSLYASAAEAAAAEVMAVAASKGGEDMVKGQGSLDELNKRLSLTERQFLAAGGLPQRPWFKHTLQAPGLYLGYAAEPFPGEM